MQAVRLALKLGARSGQRRINQPSAVEDRGIVESLANFEQANPIPIAGIIENLAPPAQELFSALLAIDVARD